MIEVSYKKVLTHLWLDGVAGSDVTVESVAAAVSCHLLLELNQAGSPVHPGPL